jgi:hypothetical protein
MGRRARAFALENLSERAYLAALTDSYEQLARARPSAPRIARA